MGGYIGHVVQHTGQHLYITPQVKMLESDWLTAGEYFTLLPTSFSFQVMMKIQDKIALIFLVVDVFGSLNMQIDTVVLKKIHWSIWFFM